MLREKVPWIKLGGNSLDRMIKGAEAVQSRKN
jgi:hypothetical protein